MNSEGLRKIEWSGYEFDYREKTSDWYWAIGIIALSISIISMIYANFLFGVFILMAAGFIMMTAKKEPRYLRFKLDEKGFHINRTFYTYESLVTFWVDERKHVPPKLLLRTNRPMNPILVIPIETDMEEPGTIRDRLLQFVPEEKMHEPMAHKLMDILGF